MTAEQTAADVMADVQVERRRQDAKWGEQNHIPMEWATVLGEEVGEVCQAVLRARFGAASLDEYRAEMIQVAAVALAALECLDRKTRGSYRRPPAAPPASSVDEEAE